VGVEPPKALEGRESARTSVTMACRTEKPTALWTGLR